MSKLYELVCTQAHYIPHDLELCCEEMVVDMGMIRRALGAVDAADDAAFADEDSVTTWWHVVLTAALEAGEEDDAS